MCSARTSRNFSAASGALARSGPPGWSIPRASDCACGCLARRTRSAESLRKSTAESISNAAVFRLTKEKSGDQTFIDARRRQARRGTAWQGQAGRTTARQCSANQAKARISAWTCRARRGVAGRSWAEIGTARQGKALRGVARILAWRGPAGLCGAMRGPARRDTARISAWVWRGLASRGMAWRGVARSGDASLGKALKANARISARHGRARLSVAGQRNQRQGEDFSE